MDERTRAIAYRRGSIRDKKRKGGVWEAEVKAKGRGTRSSSVHLA